MRWNEGYQLIYVNSARFVTLFISFVMVYDNVMLSFSLPSVFLSLHLRNLYINGNQEFMRFLRVSLSFTPYLHKACLCLSAHSLYFSSHSVISHSHSSLFWKCIFVQNLSVLYRQYVWKASYYFQRFSRSGPVYENNSSMGQTVWLWQHELFM